MGLKNAFNKMVNYFETDDTQQGDELEERLSQEEREQSVSSSPAEDKSLSRQSTAQVKNYRQEEPSRPAFQERRQQVLEQQTSQEPAQATIALKYPKKYDDAQEIVDMLINNECVLIDFQYMMDAQARRCLDYITGASYVLMGKLQRAGVSSSMYLLTPYNVTVDTKDVPGTEYDSEQSFDYDMKRR